MRSQQNDPIDQKHVDKLKILTAAVKKFHSAYYKQSAIQVSKNSWIS